MLYFSISVYIYLDFSVIIAIDPDDPAHTQQYLDIHRNVAAQFRNEFAFGFLNGVEQSRVIIFEYYFFLNISYCYF